MLPSLAVLSAPWLLALAAAAIIGLVVLITVFRCNAVVAILIAALTVGLGSGMPLTKQAAHPSPDDPSIIIPEKPGIADAFEAGVGKTLSGLVMIIGLGTMLGKLLAESGAAQVIANTLVRWLGPTRLDYAVMLVAFLVGISIFFNVGIVLLGPIAFMLARETGTPILRLGLPLAAGLSTAHGLIPPHPGPMAAIGIIGADVGKTILYSIVVGAPVALLTGPFLARWVAPRVPVELGGLLAEISGQPTAPMRPGFGVSIFTMLLPVLLMLMGTAGKIFLGEHSTTRQWADSLMGAPTFDMLRQWADFLGAPTVAMLIALLVSFYTFGKACGLTAHQILRFCEASVGPIAGLLLLIAAGGGFSTMLNASGVGSAIRDWGRTLPVSPLLLGWIMAGLLRIAIGSATVAVTTTAGLMAPIVAGNTTVNRELLILAMGSGSLILSHVNDSGFWFVKEYLGMTIEQTLKSWTIVETGIACSSIVFIMLVNHFV
jgi:GntP family gluconate:H+ symporter